jgi:hypothetical protein
MIGGAPRVDVHGRCRDLRPFAIAGAAVGWSLNQIGLRLARRTEQRESDVRDADHRVFAAATAATRFGEAVRWLVQIDMGKNVAGQGPSHITYEQVVVEAQSELRRLREALLDITVKGPDGSAPELERIVASAQELWDGMLKAKRERIGEEPLPWLLACNSLVAAAQSWAQQHSSPPNPRTH